MFSKAITYRGARHAMTILCAWPTGRIVHGISMRNPVNADGCHGADSAPPGEIPEAII